ncbi:MAG TPA: endonuclease domain-containing protein [Sphingomicrobium sp.]|nr:endonuclease domain-containing protein [Sphingomicrobium sp.]
MGATQSPPRNGEGDRSAEPSGGGGPRRINPPVLRSPIKQVKRARSLRKKLSLPEVLLWQQLRKRPNGLKFRKQFPFGEMTIDFACLERRLVIEIDGEGHSYGDQPRRDAARDALLRREGFQVLRIAARDVLKDMDAVLRYILVACSAVGPLHHDAARRGPPPRSGEEL